MPSFFVFKLINFAGIKSQKRSPGYAENCLQIFSAFRIF